MIRINLAPFEEMENPHWWVPDLAVFVLVLALSLALVNSHFSAIQSDIDAQQTKLNEVRRQADALKSDLARVKDLEGRKKKLESVRRSVMNITDSPISKFKPIILVEHLQNLKPEGVWFTKLDLDFTPEIARANVNNGREPGAPVRIEGASVDNIILAEFLILLKSTQNQEVDPADLRTKVYFKDLDLKSSNNLTYTVGGNERGRANMQERESFEVSQFSIGLSFDERDQVLNEEVKEVVRKLRSKKGRKL